MPHKRAKRSLRDQKRKESGSDLAPGLKKAIESEDIPKSVARVLNAAKIQQEWAQKKRTASEDEGGRPTRKRRRQGETADEGGGGAKRNELRIMPGESMAHFNRRVEDSMRHSVQEAMQSSSSRIRQVKKEEELAISEKKQAAAAEARTKPREKVRAQDLSDSDDESTPVKATTKGEGLKEFEKFSTSAPKRLNDIVHAPPELKKLPRKAKKLAAQGGMKKGEGAKSLSEGVLSMAQKTMLEEERERVIRLYREMKKGKAAG